MRKIPSNFYPLFFIELEKRWENIRDILGYGIDGSTSWNSAFFRVCHRYPEFQWIYDFSEAFNWIDYDELNLRILRHMQRLIRKGKL